MQEEIKRIVELEIDLENLELEEFGVDVVSFVESPAIEVDFMAFSKQEFVEPNSGESESDFMGRCIPVLVGEGYDDAQAQAICYSYYEGEYVPSGLPQYVDQIDEPKVKEEFATCEHEVMSEEEEAIVLKWAEEYGEVITEEYVNLSLDQAFDTVGDIAKAIQGLDILGKMGIRKDEPMEIRYRYTGPPAQRNACRALLSMNKMYKESDMRTLRSMLSTINPKMGPRGVNSYDVFAYKMGVNCRHYWSKIGLFKPEGSTRVLMIEQGPAEGNAGKSNNQRVPSPTGYVSNNAKLTRRRNFTFSTISEEKRLVAGPLMIPNHFILRRDRDEEGKPLGDPYYVYFSKDTIRRIQERFNKQLRQNITDIDHDGQIRHDNILLEQWIIESREHDKSRFYGFDGLPVGTWFGVYKVNDDKTWQMIKDGKARGFSIAGDFINKVTKPEAGTDLETLEKIVNILKDIK